MFHPSSTSAPAPVATPARRPRRGVALIFVMVFVVAMAALAMASIFMASNSNLLAKSYDRERDLKYAAEAALAIGKSRVNADPLVLSLPVDTLYRKILDSTKIVGADGSYVPGVYVRVYVGPTGSTSGQAGRFSSIIAEARDQRGNGFIRRLELTQESFAKFAYWSADESNGTQTIFFNNGDELWGPVWSNDTIHIGSGGATFHDEVGTAGIVSGAQYGTFSKGRKEKQKPITLPSTTVLNLLQGYAGSYAFTTGDALSSNEDNVRDRIEFIAIDLGGTPDSVDANEGFFRVYQAYAGQENWLRGDWPGKYSGAPGIATVNECGDWHYMVPRIATDTGAKFFPASVHNTQWFQDAYKAWYLWKNPGASNTTANNAAVAERNRSLSLIMAGNGARCYLGGDPHLVSVERPNTYPIAEYQKGGDDTTFTAVGIHGKWIQYSATPNALVTAKRGGVQAQYLFPLDRGLNGNVKGVIYSTGNIGVSGVLNGKVTLYSKGTIVLLDDLRYSNDPVKGVCLDILGLLTDRDIVVADNALNMPANISSSTDYHNVDDTKDVTIHAVMMALNTSFRVQNYASGPSNVNDCETVQNGRGCIYLSGGLIQQARGPVGTSWGTSGTGFAKRYAYDHCAVVSPPPYFPTTGRFLENRYIELDPAGFNPFTYFKSVTPG